MNWYWRSHFELFSLIIKQKHKLNQLEQFKTRIPTHTKNRNYVKFLELIIFENWIVFLNTENIKHCNIPIKYATEDYYPKCVQFLTLANLFSK